MKQIKEFTKSKSNKEFKSKFLAMTDSNVPKKLNEVNFDIKRLSKDYGAEMQQTDTKYLPMNRNS